MIASVFFEIYCVHIFPVGKPKNGFEMPHKNYSGGNKKKTLRRKRRAFSYEQKRSKLRQFCH